MASARLPADSLLDAASPGSNSFGRLRGLGFDLRIIIALENRLHWFKRFDDFRHQPDFAIWRDFETTG